MKRLAAALILVAGLGASTASAQSGGIPRGQVFSVDPVVDGLGAVGLVGAALLLDRNKYAWSKVDPCEGARRRPTPEDFEAYRRLAPNEGVCDVASVPKIDRLTLGLKSKSADRLADALLLSLVASPLVFSGLDTLAADVTAARIGDDSAVTFQALGATYLATMILKVAVSRPRPLTHDPAFDKSTRFSGSSRLSFPSGHSAISFSAASVLAVMLAERYGTDPGAVAGIVGAYTAATTVAVARVLGGKHFVTDVVAGAALGTAMGLTIPLLHTMTREAGSRPAEAAATVVGFGGAF